MEAFVNTAVRKPAHSRLPFNTMLANDGLASLAVL